MAPLTNMHLSSAGIPASPQVLSCCEQPRALAAEWPVHHSGCPWSWPRVRDKTLPKQWQAAKCNADVARKWPTLLLRRGLPSCQPQHTGSYPFPSFVFYPFFLPLSMQTSLSLLFPVIPFSFACLASRTCPMFTSRSRRSETSCSDRHPT